VNTIQFSSKDAFIKALEERRRFWREYDKRQEQEHKTAEKQYLASVREKLREALKWDYATLKKNISYDDLPVGKPPACPVVMEPKVDRVLRALSFTNAKSFRVDTSGVWADAHDLLTRDPDERKTVC
jgi:hypothetical protein